MKTNSMMRADKSFTIESKDRRILWHKEQLEKLESQRRQAMIEELIRRSEERIQSLTD